MSTKPLVWAHRGASGYAPENTLAAFQKAVDLGADGVELDIQLTKDDQIVVIHDETIDRTCDGKGWVKDYTLEELRAFNYNRTKPEYEHADIPTMREVFELLKPTGLFINIEIKTGVVFYEKIEEKILALTKEMGMEDRVCYSSFNHYTVTRIHELKPDAEVGFLYADGPIDMPSYGVKHGVNALHPALYNLQYDGFVKECKEKGLKLNVWTVNERPYMEMCCQYGVDAIITNYPDIAKEVVG
mgnify:FL=1